VRELMETERNSFFRTLVGMMMTPGAALKSSIVGTKWYFSLAVSAVAFGLFFLQTGLDLYNTGQKGFSFVLLSTGLGFAYGLLAIPLMGAIVWLILKAAKTDKDLKWAISSFCLSYSGALLFGILGLAFSIIFGWRTSVAFGVTGVLWAIGPMIVTIRTMTGGKNIMSIPIVSVLSAAILISWAWLGRI
jgi:hypothetical protein